MKRHYKIVLKLFLLCLGWVGMLQYAITNGDPDELFVVKCFPSLLLIFFGAYACIRIGYSLFTLSKSKLIKEKTYRGMQ